MARPAKYTVTDLGPGVQPRSVNVYGDVLVTLDDGSPAVWHDGVMTQFPLPPNLLTVVGAITDQRWVLVESPSLGGYRRFDYVACDAATASGTPFAAWGLDVFRPAPVPVAPVLAVSRAGLLLAKGEPFDSPDVGYVIDEGAGTTQRIDWERSVFVRAINDQGNVFGAVYDTVGMGNFALGAHGVGSTHPGATVSDPAAVGMEGGSPVFVPDLLCNDGIAGLGVAEPLVGPLDARRPLKASMVALVGIQPGSVPTLVDRFIDRNGRGTRVNDPFYSRAVVFSDATVSCDVLFGSAPGWSGAMAAALSEDDHVVGSADLDGTRHGFLLSPERPLIKLDVPSWGPQDIIFGLVNDGPGGVIDRCTGRVVPVPPRWLDELLEQLRPEVSEALVAQLRSFDPDGPDAENELRRGLIELLYGGGPIFES